MSDIKKRSEEFWVSRLKLGGATRVFAGRCDDEDVDTPFVVCRCQEAPVTMPGGGAYRVDPFEILVISHINEADSAEHSSAVEYVRYMIESTVFPFGDGGVVALGRGPLTIRDVASEDDERYADIFEFVFGVADQDESPPPLPDALM